MYEIDPNKPGTSRFWKLRNDARAVEGPWRWPLPRLAQRDPVALPVGEDERCGLDIGYAGHEFSGPLFVPVYAVQRGEVTFAGETTKGFAVTIDHGSLQSHYAHLDRIFVIPGVRRTRRRELVKPGQVIGYAAKAPVHIRFELWEQTYTQGAIPVDALVRMKDWMISPTADELRPTVAASSDQEAA